MQRTDN